MAEMHAMTNRMNELCIQAANGTNSASDRSYIQMEVDGIVSEFDRIIDTTKFNEVYIFKGEESSLAATVSSVSTSSQTVMSGGSGIGSVYGITAYSGTNLSDTLPGDFSYDNWGTTKATTNSYGVGPNPIKAGTGCAWVDFTNFTADSREDLIDKLEGQGFDSSCNRCNAVFYGIKFVSDGNNNETTSSGIPYHYHSTPSVIPMPVPSGTIVSEVLKIDLNNIWDRYTGPGEHRTLGEIICETLVAVVDDAGGPADTFSTPAQKHFNSCLSQHFTGYAYKKGRGKLYLALIPFSSSPGSSTFSLTPRDDNGNIEAPKPAKQITITITKECIINPKRQLAIQAGTDADSTNKVMMELPTMNSRSLRLNKISVLTENLAKNSLRVLTDTLQLISAGRSRMGAYQNRLEHTARNLDNVIENTTASESGIRDTDMAGEMVRYSNNNILAQAGQSMLSQANSSQQRVITLLTA